MAPDNCSGHYLVDRRQKARFLPAALVDGACGALAEELSAATTDAAPFAPLALCIECGSRQQRLAGMLGGVVLDVTLVGVIARGGTQPTPDRSNPHERVNLNPH